MALTNRQYDAIMRLYDKRQYQNYRTQSRHQDEVYQRFPRIRELEEKISSLSLQKIEKLYTLDGNDTEAFDCAKKETLTELKNQLLSLRKEKEALLQKAGYPADYLELSYTCKDCQDTGYIGQKKCHCFRKEEIRLLYSSSRLEAILQEENFSTLSFEVYDEEQRIAIPPIIHICENFIEYFDTEFQGLLFYGPVGTGKTFLTNCIAKELLDRGHSVIYFTAFQLFEHFSLDQKPEDLETFGQRHEALLDSDLLILDDIGTEMANTFTVSKLFQVLNERALRRKSTIISTNLSPKDFRDIYSERVFSRITSTCKLVKFTGSDIRIRRKISGSR